MSELKEIGARIRKVRTERGYSQEELSFNAEMDRAYISEIESGQKNFSINVLFKLSKALEIEPEELIKGINKNSYT